MPLDTAELRNLFAVVEGNVRRYVERLFEIDATIRQGITRRAKDLDHHPRFDHSTRPEVRLRRAMSAMKGKVENKLTRFSDSFQAPRPILGAANKSEVL